MDRRNFVKKAAAVTVITSLNRNASHAAETSIPQRTLGRTGERVSIIGIGGFHLGPPSEEEAIRIVRTALDNGVNFLDNCWDYNDGASEERMGKALRDGYRQKAFLMTKIDGRTKAAATAQLNESLRRLQADHIDLLQFHEVIRDNDPERIFSPGPDVVAFRVTIPASSDHSAIRLTSTYWSIDYECGWREPQASVGPAHSAPVNLMQDLS